MSLAGVWYNQNILPKQDTPNGAINGSNTIFALSFLLAGVSLPGIVIRQPPA